MRSILPFGCFLLLAGCAYRTPPVHSPATIPAIAQRPLEGTYVGRASASRLGSLYAPARRRALAVALDEALARAEPGRR